MNFSGDDVFEDDNLDINVTSLVDILFNLLIFFMVSTTFSGSTGIRVNLPRASAGVVQPAGKNVTITVDDKGGVFVDDRQVSAERLSSVLAALASAGPQTVIVRADRQVNHGLVVSVLDAAKAAGIEKISIGTAGPEPAKASK